MLARKKEKLQEVSRRPVEFDEALKKFDHSVTRLRETVQRKRDRVELTPVEMPSAGLAEAINEVLKLHGCDCPACNHLRDLIKK